MQFAPTDRANVLADTPATSRPELQATADCRVVTSASLFNGQQQMRIIHEGSTYTLRLTRGGKLILTK